MVENRIYQHKKWSDTFESIFDDRMAGDFRFQDLESLVNRLEGRVTFNGSSHVKIILPGGIGFSWRPHGKSHDSKVPKACVQGFRDAFISAGMVPKDYRP